MTISIAIATQQNLGNAVSQYHAEDKFEDRVTGKVYRGVLEDFERIQGAVERAVKQAEKVDSDDRIPCRRWILG